MLPGLNIGAPRSVSLIRSRRKCASRSTSLLFNASNGDTLGADAVGEDALGEDAAGAGAFAASGTAGCDVRRYGPSVLPYRSCRTTRDRTRFGPCGVPRASAPWHATQFAVHSGI